MSSSNHFHSEPAASAHLRPTPPTEVRVPILFEDCDLQMLRSLTLEFVEQVNWQVPRILMLAARQESDPGVICCLLDRAIDDCEHLLRSAFEVADRLADARSKHFPRDQFRKPVVLDTLYRRYEERGLKVQLSTVVGDHNDLADALRTFVAEAGKDDVDLPELAVAHIQAADACETFEDGVRDLWAGLLEARATEAELGL